MLGTGGKVGSRSEVHVRCRGAPIRNVGIVLTLTVHVIRNLSRVEGLENRGEIDVCVRYQIVKSLSFQSVQADETDNIVLLWLLLFKNEIVFICIVKVGHYLALN